MANSRERDFGGQTSRTVYAIIVHLLAVCGVLYVAIDVISIYDAREAGEPYIRQAESWPRTSPYHLPEGVAKPPAHLECREVYIKNTPICKIWFLSDGLYRFEFVPPGGSTAWAFATTSLTDDSQDTDRWLVTVDTYDDNQSPWIASFPILSVRDNLGIGIPEIAVLWADTQAVQTYKDQDVWSVLKLPKYYQMMMKRGSTNEPPNPDR